MPIFIKLTIFLQSFLFFAIQPAVAKLLLPKVGGSSQAWIISLLFFQFFLLLGYSLNSVLDKKVKIYLLILFGALGFYFNHNLYNFKIESDFDLLIFLILNYGAFSLLLAFSNPFLQKIAGSYSLYSISNIGSLLALLSYPFLVERYLNLSTQFLIFKSSFLVFLIMLLFCALKANALESTKEINLKIKDKNLIHVFLFSLCLNSLLIIVTNNLCLHFAEAPFLWILPLVVFLIAFIVGFFEKDIINTDRIKIYTNYSLFILPILLIFTVKTYLVAYLVIIFVSYYFISYRLVREAFKLKPDVSNLVPFYIYLSSGGVVGTILVGILSPIFFVNFYEIVLIFCLIAYLLNEKKNLNYILIISLIFALSLVNLPILNNNLVFILYFVSYFLILIILKKDSQKLLLLALLVSISFSLNKSSNTKKLLLSTRNYYGVKEVKSIKNVNHFFHGKVVHGIQDLNNPSKVYAYAGKNSGVFDVITEVNKKEGIKDVLVIGLGIGNIAAYSGDNNYTFIEIDPQVVNIAKNEKYFTYLKNCKSCKTIVGDGRLETQKLNQKFDLIILDAFTSGAVPLHLITKEALILYKSKLKKDGLIVFNISHSYFNILKALYVNAKKLNLKLLYKVSESESNLEYPNKYAVLVNEKNLMFYKLIKRKFNRYITKVKLSDWTDDRSSLIDIIN